MHSTARALRTIRPGFFRRPYTTTPVLRGAWTPGPAPPRLPKEEQEIFDKLQQASTGAFSTPKPSSPPSQDQQRNTTEQASAADALLSASQAPRSSEADDMLEQLRERARLAAKGDGEELHPNVRRGAAPEFEGETNPKTGEVGGPKNEPLRWGVAGDWSYNGRVTDF